jgi:hypothetical protein
MTMAWWLISRIVRWGIWLVTGTLMGFVVIISVINHYSDGVIEQWTFRDMSGVAWDCSRMLGADAVCSRTQEGQLTFLLGEAPQFSSCVVKTTTTSLP